jgi:endonuclease I
MVRAKSIVAVAVWRAFLLAGMIDAQPEQPLDNCNAGGFYDDFNLASEDMRAALADLVTSKHRRQLPYTADGEEDVWDALMDLDGDGTDVTLIYSGSEMSNELAGDSRSGWNREHLWPQSLGVGDSGAAFADVHHLRPSGWRVNSARGNKFFGSCLDESTDSCTIPAHDGAASDTEADALNFLPPEAVRGDIARALFYMDIRYNESTHEVDLVLSDCPGGSSNTMGYLSQLLEWHQDDPVSDEELDRNEKACYWQGNRNPFVDFPNIVEDVYGTDVASRPYECPPTTAPVSNPANETSSPSASPVAAPSDVTPSPGPAPTAGSGSTPSDGTATCSNTLRAGSVAVVGLNSQNPDTVALVALSSIPAGITLYMTDNGFDGTSLRQDEGVIKYTTSSPMYAGQVFGYERSDSEFSTLLDSSEWQVVDGTFALAMDGDSVLVFCVEGDDDSLAFEAPKFLAGFTWSRNSTAWKDLGDTTSSALPADLEGYATGLSRNKGKDHTYVGPTEGLLSSELLQEIVDPANWNSSSVSAFNFDDMKFKIRSPLTGAGNVSATSETSGVGEPFAPLLSLLVPYLAYLFVLV